VSGDGRTPVVRLAPAKLNLTLAVVGTLPNGFHELHSVMVPLALGDRLSLARAACDEDSLHVVDGGGRTLDPAEFGSVLAGIREARRAVGRAADAFPLAARL
jgi:4-diphosphocytidyl-2C-methyl-D-erythritol kinase